MTQARAKASLSMSVPGMSATASNAGILQLFQLRSQALKSLESAVRSGDIGTAQDALATLDEDTQYTPFSSSDSAAQSSDSSSSGGFAPDLTALLQAVQSGNLADAQQAASAFQNDLQNAAQQVDPTGTTSTSTTSQSTNSTSSGGFASDLTVLMQAVQSGNLADAQQAASTLQNDMQNAAQQVSGGVHAHHHQHHQAPSTGQSGTTNTASTSTLTSISTTSAVATAPDDAILLIQAYYLSN